MRLSRLLRRLSSSEDAYRPVLPRRVDRRRLVRDVADLLGVAPGAVRTLYERYGALHREKRYEARFGERKTLNRDEAFAVYAVLSVLGPRGPVVEIGTQYGRSTRRILDMLSALGLDNRVVCYDTSDRVEHFTRDEADLRIEDLTGRFQEAVLDALSPGVVFLDAHPYHLTKEVITRVLASQRECVLVIHDCGKALCNPRMPLSKDDPAITSATGHWERHVLCEAFGVADPMSAAIDRQVTPTHTLAILQTTHGLGVIVPRRMVERAAARGDRARDGRVAP